MSSTTAARTPAQLRAERKRASVAAARYQSARAVFAELEPGHNSFTLTHGQFSLIDVIETILDTTGPAALTVSTWTAAGADMEHAERFLTDGRITSLRFLVDRSYLNRQPGYCATMRRLFGDDCIRTTRSHAKFVTLRNPEWDIAIRTSMNLNLNPRLEYLEVSDDPQIAGFLDGVVDELFGSVRPGDFGSDMPRAVPPPAMQMGGTVRVGQD